MYRDCWLTKQHNVFCPRHWFVEDMVNWVVDQRKQRRSFKSIFKKGYNLHYQGENALLRLDKKHLNRFLALEHKRNLALYSTIDAAVKHSKVDGRIRIVIAGKDHVENIADKLPDGVSVLVPNKM